MLKNQFKRKQQYEKQNLLKREFSAGHPNQIWVSDITYLKVKKLLGLSLHHLGFILTQNRRVADIPKHEHKPGHSHI